MPHVFQRHPYLTVAFGLAAALTLWLLVEVVSGALHWSGQRDEPLAPWMTMGYVGRVHGISGREIDALAGFPTPQEAGHPLTIAEIAARQGVPVDTVIDEVQAALAELQHGHGPDSRRDGTPSGGATDGPAE